MLPRWCARAATGLPCYQHVLEMLRSADYDAALIGAAESAAQVAQAAAGRGAALLLVGDQADGATLLEAAEAALQHRVPLTVIRPRLQQAGLAFVFSLAAADSGWRPRLLDLSLAGGAAVPALLRDAAAIADRLLPDTPTHAVASFLGGDPDETTAIAAELRYADGRLVSVRARAGAVERFALYAGCALGVIELTSEDGESTLSMTLRDGSRETSRLPDGDTLALEAARVVQAARGEPCDALLASRDGIVLRALELALDSGSVALVENRSTRANLHLVEGGSIPATPPSGRLRLVGG